MLQIDRLNRAAMLVTQVGSELPEPHGSMFRAMGEALASRAADLPIAIRAHAFAQGERCQLCDWLTFTQEGERDCTQPNAAHCPAVQAALHPGTAVPAFLRRQAE